MRFAAFAEEKEVLTNGLVLRWKVPKGTRGFETPHARSSIVQLLLLALRCSAEALTELFLGHEETDQ